MLLASIGEKLSYKGPQLFDERKEQKKREKERNRKRIKADKTQLVVLPTQPINRYHSTVYAHVNLREIIYSLIATYYWQKSCFLQLVPN